MDFLAALVAIVALVFVLKMRKRVSDLELRIAQFTGTHVWRALSLICLGLVLVGIGRLYQKLLFAKKPDAVGRVSEA